MMFRGKYFFKINTLTTMILDKIIYIFETINSETSDANDFSN